MKNLTIFRKVLASRALNPTEKIIIAALLTAAPKDTVCSVSLSELEKMTGLWKSTVCGSLTKLTERGYIKVNLTYQNRAKREYQLNTEQLTVPSEGPSPCKTKSTAREIHKFGTPMTETERVLSHAVTSFNQILPEFVNLQNPTESDAKKFTALLEQNPYLKHHSWWEEYFTEIRKCPWLMGKNPRHWMPSFSFLIKESTILKVKAGGYGGQKPEAAPKESAEEYAERLYERLFGKCRTTDCKEKGE